MNNKLKYLTFSAALLIVVHPFVESALLPQVVVTLMGTMVCFLGIIAVSTRRLNLIAATMLGVPWFVLNWVYLAVPPTSILLACIPLVFQIAFFLFTASVLFQYVSGIAKSVQTQNSHDAVYGAISVYILVGGAFGILYSLLELNMPGSFQDSTIVKDGGGLDQYDLWYLSFITLTTLGFGDVSPVTPQARMLTVIEAIFGVMYLAVVIGRLVSLYSAQLTKSNMRQYSSAEKQK